MNETSTITASKPVLQTALELARAAVRDFYASCFWFWKIDPPLHTEADVRNVISHLREYGDRKAWQAAQAIVKCL